MENVCLKCGSQLIGDIHNLFFKCDSCDTYYQKYLSILTKKAEDESVDPQEYIDKIAISLQIENRKKSELEEIWKEEYALRERLRVKEELKAPNSNTTTQDNFKENTSYTPYKNTYIDELVQDNIPEEKYFDETGKEITFAEHFNTKEGVHLLLIATTNGLYDKYPTTYTSYTLSYLQNHPKLVEHLAKLPIANPDRGIDEIYRLWKATYEYNCDKKKACLLFESQDKAPLVDYILSLFEKHMAPKLTQKLEMTLGEGECDCFLSIAIDDIEDDLFDYGTPEEIKLANNCINKHISTLTRKKSSGCKVDDYGIKDDSLWLEEKDYFLNKVIIPALDDGDIEEDLRTQIEELIEAQIEEKTKEHHSINTKFDNTMDGFEYEHYVAKLFQESGWQAKVTQGSGDQGADVLANKDGISMAVQCKKYSKPVGNKAVQEVASAKGFYKTNLAIVVTNNDYTPSAKALAKELNIALLHHTQITKNWIHPNMI